MPLAGRPDIVRASQKDESYTSHTLDLLQDVTRRLFGPRHAVLYARELELAARLLYAFVSTGCSQQTPGEEYCDILQVAGDGHKAPGTLRRLLLVALQGCGPYLIEGLQVNADASSSSGPAWKLIAYASKCLPWALRLQLASFYLSGIFYQWTHRFTGVKYLFVGKVYEKRPSYRILGILMFLQLAVSAASWAYSQALQPQQDEQSALESSASQQKAKVVKSTASGPPPTPPSSQRCPLCLSPRDTPTATPCGHVFCWTCISSWSNHKPECPLCRSPFTGSDLVCLHYSDY